MKIVPTSSTAGLIRRSGSAVDALSTTIPSAAEAVQGVSSVNTTSSIQCYQITTRPRFQQTNMNVLIASLMEGTSSVLYFEQLLAQHDTRSAKMNIIVINTPESLPNDGMNIQQTSKQQKPISNEPAATTDMKTSRSHNNANSTVLTTPHPPLHQQQLHSSWFASCLPPCRRLLVCFRHIHCSCDCDCGAVMTCTEGDRHSSARHHRVSGRQALMKEEDIHRITRDMLKTMTTYSNNNNTIALHPSRLTYSTKTGVSSSHLLSDTDAEIRRNKEYADFLGRCRHTALPLLIDRLSVFESLQTRVSSITNFAFLDTIRCVLEANYSATGPDRLLTVVAGDAGTYEQFQDFFTTLLSYTESQSLTTGPSAAGSYCSDPLTNNRTNTILYATICPGIPNKTTATTSSTATATDYQQHLMTVLNLPADTKSFSATNQSRFRSASKQMPMTMASYTNSDDYDLTKTSFDFNEYCLDMEFISQVSVDLSRNLKGFAFPSTIDRKQRRYVEFILHAACQDLASELSSSSSSCVSCHYLSLSEITLLPEAIQQHLDRFEVNYYTNKHSMTDTSSFYLAGELYIHY